MAVANIQLNFGNSFHGVMKGPNGEVLIGSHEGEMEPYHLLFGALGSCFYATFLQVARKMKLDFDRVAIEVRGQKRNAQITTLEFVEMDITIFGGTDEAKLKKAAELGAQYCSIHDTIGKVATMTLNVLFA